jgi:hypothetical protein
MHEQGLTAIKTTFERFGVEFLNDCGVRLRAGAGNGGTDPSGSSEETCWIPSNSS